MHIVTLIAFDILMLMVVVIIGALGGRVARLERAVRRLRRDGIRDKAAQDNEITSVEALAERRFNEGIASILGYSVTPAAAGGDGVRTGEEDA